MAVEGSEFAPAKINLTLHVVGQRADGYHLLDSLVVFADVGDHLTAVAGDALSLTISGPFSINLPVTDDNLILRAARQLGATASLHLTKVLPVSSGIGGGSADAAATLRLLTRIGRYPMPGLSAVLRLGADVPVCLAGRAARMTGVGETVHPIAALPPAWLVLVNPGVAVSTPVVFRAMTRRDNAAMPTDIPRLNGFSELASFVAMQRNDMEAAAISLAPVIAAVKSALTSQHGCAVARMSGSGATCFGLFADGLTATAAARQIQAAQPGWWVAAAKMIS